MKAMLHERIYNKTLSDQVLSRGKEEILQAVYTYFGKKEIHISGLFVDDNLNQLGQKASQSVLI